MSVGMIFLEPQADNSFKLCSARSTLTTNRPRKTQTPRRHRRLTTSASRKSFSRSCSYDTLGGWQRTAPLKKTNAKHRQAKHDLLWDFVGLEKKKEDFSSWQPTITFLYLFLFHSVLCLTSFLSQNENQAWSLVCDIGHLLNNFPTEEMRTQGTLLTHQFKSVACWENEDSNWAKPKFLPNDKHQHYTNQHNLM